MLYKGLVFPLSFPYLSLRQFLALKVALIVREILPVFVP